MSAFYDEKGYCWHCQCHKAEGNYLYQFKISSRNVTFDQITGMVMDLSLVVKFRFSFSWQLTSNVELTSFENYCFLLY